MPSRKENRGLLSVGKPVWIIFCAVIILAIWLILRIQKTAEPLTHANNATQLLSGRIQGHASQDLGAGKIRTLM